MDSPAAGQWGAICKSVFRQAITDGFDVVGVWRMPMEQAGVLETLTRALAQNPSAGGVLGTSSSPFHPLSRVQSAIAGQPLGDWYPAISLFRTDALKRVMFELNTNDDYFETELLLQLIRQSIPLVYAVVPVKRPSIGIPKMVKHWKAALKFRLQSLYLFYDFRYYPSWFLPSEKQNTRHPDYPLKPIGRTPHTFVLQEGVIPVGSRVLDLGCSQGHLARALVTQRQCTVWGVDHLAADQVELIPGFHYQQLDLEHQLDELCERISKNEWDVILLLDVLEHLPIPEKLLWRLSQLSYRSKPVFILSTANVAFIVIRVMLLLGYFNYGERGILDITHKRLFSWRTFRNLMDQMGFQIRARHSFPVPYRAWPLPAWMAALLEKIHLGLLWIRPSVFAYQVLFIAQPFHFASSSDNAHTRTETSSKSAESSF